MSRYETNRNVPSDARLGKLPAIRRLRQERFYEIFFKLCKKYNVHDGPVQTKKKSSSFRRLWHGCLERDKAKRLGLPLSKIRPSFTQ